MPDQHSASHAALLGEQALLEAEATRSEEEARRARQAERPGLDGEQQRSSSGDESLANVHMGDRALPDAVAEESQVGAKVAADEHLAFVARESTPHGAFDFANAARPAEAGDEPPARFGLEGDLPGRQPGRTEDLADGVRPAGTPASTARSATAFGAVAPVEPDPGTRAAAPDLSIAAVAVAQPAEDGEAPEANDDPPPEDTVPDAPDPPSVPTGAGPGPAGGGTEPADDPPSIDDDEPAEPSLAVTDATGAEDSPIALDIRATLGDLEGLASLSFTISGVPSGATLSAGTDNGDGTWTLTPAELPGLTITPPANSDADFTLSVTATATEGGAGTLSTSAQLTITVDPVADTPALAVANASGDEDSAIALDIQAALTDLDGSETLSITISDVPSGATLSAGTDNGDGTWTLTLAQIAGLTITPPPGSDVDFTLTVSATASEAGGESSTTQATLDVTVNPALESDPDLPLDIYGETHTGTGGADSINGANGTDLVLGLDGDDTLLGGSADDRLEGGAGNDALDGGNANDTLIGGAGNDDIKGGSGNDIIQGGAGNDTIDGGNGSDSISGGSGDDALDGGTGDDVLDGGSGNDILDGGNGDDAMFGGTGDDTLDGGTGDDTLDGGTGDDTMTGGNGDDTFIGGTGDDQAAGGTGDDLFIFHEGDGSDAVVGDAGSDTIWLQAADGGLPADGWTIALDQGSIVDSQPDHMVLSSDAVGTIVLADGSELTFQGVEVVQW